MSLNLLRFFVLVRTPTHALKNTYFFSNRISLVKDNIGMKKFNRFQNPNVWLCVLN